MFKCLLQTVEVLSFYWLCAETSDLMTHLGSNANFQIYVYKVVKNQTFGRFKPIFQELDIEMSSRY